MDARSTKGWLMKKSPSHESGFTFVEVMIALVLLASASAILVGMQSAAVHRTIRDTPAQKSMMVARRGHRTHF